MTGSTYVGRRCWKPKVGFAGTGTGTLIVQEHETGKSAEATATGSLLVNGVQFIGGFTSAGIIQESTGSVDIKTKQQGVPRRHYLGACPLQARAAAPRP